MSIDSILKFFVSHPLGIYFVALAWMIVELYKARSNKSFKVLLDANTQQHNELFARIDKMSIALTDISFSLNLSKSNKDYIDKMNEGKFYLLSKIKDEKIKHFACYKADNFIAVIEDILRNYNFSVNEIEKIQTYMNSSASTVKVQMIAQLGEDITRIFYYRHDVLMKDYIKEITAILLDTDNHHKLRFIKASNNFLQQFMNELISLGQ